MINKKFKKLSLLKSKKGGIPAINEIVMTFLNVTPKPILLLIFIILIGTVANFVLPAFLNLFGYSCVEEFGSLELYQTPLSSLVSKTFLDVKRVFEGILLPDDFQLPQDPFPDGDKKFLRIPQQCFVQSDLNGSTVYGYTAQCTNCDTNANFLQGFFTPRSSLICTDDGTDKIINVLGAKFCSQCSPPYPYFYNHSNCIDSDECFFTITNTSLISTVDDNFADNFYLKNILSLGGVKRVQDSKEIANIQCVDVGKPSLFFFSIEVFNVTLWIYLLLGGLLITIAFAWYRQIL